MLVDVPWMPPNLTKAAVEKVRRSGLAHEVPSQKGAFVPFVVAFADGACRGRGLHHTMDVCPGTTIPQMVQRMHRLAPIARWDGVAGFTMDPDPHLLQPHGPFELETVRRQWLPFMQFLSPNVQAELLIGIVRPKWYPFVMGKLGPGEFGLPGGFKVDAVVQTTSRHDFGNLTLVFDLAAGPLATLPKAMDPGLVNLMCSGGHSNTVVIVGANYEGELPEPSGQQDVRIPVDHSVGEMMQAVMTTWLPDQGFDQPEFRVATKAAAVSPDCSATTLDVFRNSPWAKLGEPEVLTAAQVKAEATVPGTIVIVSRQPWPDQVVLTNGVSREPEFTAIPYDLLPRKQL